MFHLPSLTFRKPLTAAWLQTCWDNDQEVDLDEFATQSVSLGAARFCDLVHIDQRARWQRGERPVVEDYLLRFPALSENNEIATDLSYHEYLLREEFGECTELESFLARFPACADSLQEQIAFHMAILGSAQQAPHADGNADDGCSRAEDGVPEIEGYELQSLIAVGGTAVVYRARQLRLNRQVAIKLLLHAFPSKQSRQRFNREAQAIAKLDHQNIVNVFDFGEVRDRPYLVLGYVSGGTLSEHCRGHAVPSIEAARLMATVALAIQHCHDHGVIHRDLKPDNILLEPCDESALSRPTANAQSTLANWTPKVTDFGLSKLTANDMGDFRTHTSSIFGTPSYMAPEQVSGEGGTNLPSVDIYSLGAVLYELLTGRPPFQGATALDVLQQVASEQPIAPGRLTRGLPESIETICLKCLSRDPLKRYATASDLAADLKRYIRGAPILARPPTRLHVLADWSRRNPTKATVFVLTGIALSVAWAGVSLHHRTLRKSHFEGLVASLVNADTTRVRDTLHSLRRDPQEARQALQTPTSMDTQRDLHLIYARLLFGIGDQQELVALVPTANLSELQLISELPGGWSATSQQSLWDLTLDDHQSAASRLRTAAAIAAVDPQDPRWQLVKDVVATAISAEAISDAVGWQRILAPLRNTLSEPLISALDSSNHTTPAKLIIASTLASFLQDSPSRLASVLLDADEEAYPSLLAGLADDDSAIRVLEKAFDQPAVATPSANTLAYSPESLAYYEQEILRSRRRAAAAIALAKLGHDKALTDLFTAANDPTACNRAIERVAKSSLPLSWPMHTVQNAQHGAVIRSCVLACGQYEPDSLGRRELDELKKVLVSMPPRFLNDGGVLAALDWLDRHWNLGLANDLTAIATRDFDHALDCGTWINGQGQAFVVVLPSRLQLGSPSWEEEHETDEQLHEFDSTLPFVMARHEVTIEELRRWKSDFPINPRYSTDRRDPANNVSYFDAAAYCRWLSEQEGIAEDQMCFPPLAQIKPGMDLPTDYYERTGYRLPSEDEWEFACRAGSSVTWPFGIDTTLINAYANCANGMRNRTWNVDKGKPNALGLYNMVGNVREWCVNAYHPRFEKRRLTASTRTVDAATLRVVRGASFGDVSPSLRAARTSAETPGSRFAAIGLRLVRSLSNHHRLD